MPELNMLRSQFFLLPFIRLTETDTLATAASAARQNCARWTPPSALDTITNITTITAEPVL